MTRRRAARLAVVVASVVVLALVAASIAVVLVVRRPLPQTSGELDLPVLDEAVTVTRDQQGVPRLVAQGAEDLFRAQGFVHAQERFFEMDYRRHVTAGRLSELVGPNRDALAADRVIRTLGWRDVAEQEWDLLAESTRSYLTAYAEGVNAYLDGRRPESMAVEYTVLGLQVEVDQPEPWDPVDSLAWLKAMAWDLRGNYDEELARVTTYASVQDVGRVSELFPAYPYDLNAPILVPVEQASATVAPGGNPGGSADPHLLSEELAVALESATAALAAVPHLVGEGEGVGSNSWVVAGQHTESGKPLLANDPHLRVSAPGVWTQIGLRCAEVSAECPFDVSGFSFAGFPGVMIGHNAQLAWGLTTLRADVTDFFVERTGAEDYLRDGVREPLTTRTEVIEVNGAEDVELEVRSTVHGPIISGVLPEVSTARVSPLADERGVGSYEIALGWTALTPGRTADAVFAVNTAAGPEDVVEAARLFDVPSQNIVYATTDGHIGYVGPGRVPVRQAIPGSPVPADGSWPRPGWDSRYDWQGYVDPAQMPAVQDPPEGYIVTANQAVAPPGVGPFLTRDWDYGYRAQRIRTLLEEAIAAGEKVDVADMNALQLDEHNPYADMLVETLLGIELASEFDAAGQRLLREWDGVAREDSAAAAYFAAVWSTLLELTFWDELPESARPSGSSRWLEVVAGLLERPDSPWWDDRTTIGVVEGRDEILSRALTSARLELAVEMGKEASSWEWGKVHLAAPRHGVLGGEGVPSMIRDMVNPDPIGVGGGSSVVNATSWDPGAQSYEVTAAPSMRMVVDLGDLDHSTWVDLTGVSGHPLSPHYDDQFDDWAAGRTFPWPFTPEALEDAVADTLTLRP